MTIVAILLLLLALAVWAAWIEPRKLIIRRYDVPLKGLKKPLRAVIVGDLQPNKYHWSKERLSAVFSQISANEQPDLTLWLGDYYNGHTDKTKLILDNTPALKNWIDQQLLSMRDISDAMALLPGRLGAFGVLGNHDWAWSANETMRHLKRVDITVLSDDIATVEDPETRQTIQIIGYEDVSSGRIPDFARLHDELDTELPTITLSHSPDAFPIATGAPDLMISGHTHGGQVRLPILGPILLPIKYREYDRGWFERDGRRLFVTSGIGTSLPPLRFLVPPEIVVLELIPETPRG